MNTLPKLGLARLLLMYRMIGAPGGTWVLGWLLSYLLPGPKILWRRGRATVSLGRGLCQVYAQWVVLTEVN